MPSYPFKPFGVSTKHFCHGKFRLTVFPALALILILGAAPASRADASCNGIMAEGGDVVEEDGVYCVHIFTTVGESSFEVKVPWGLDVDYLVVAGGGGGGNNSDFSYAAAGGGGAGGLLKDSAFLSKHIYTVTVGSGGAGSNGHSRGGRGNDSSIIGNGVGIQAAGGGGGGGGPDPDGEDGGSGGGARTGTTMEYKGGKGTQGFDGGDDKARNNLGGAGGGGAGEAGGDGGVSYDGAAGGDGILSDITGTRYAGGGGGGASRDVTGTTGGSGGKGGGGDGADYDGEAEDGDENTGGGGGGGRAGSGGAGGNGGSGIVVVRYELKSDIRLTGGSPAITIEAPWNAGAEPDQKVEHGDAKLKWVSVGTNDIQVKTDSPLPGGVKLYVKVGDNDKKQVDSDWETVFSSSNTTGKEDIEYSVEFDNVSNLVATDGLVDVNVKFRIGP